MLRTKAREAAEQKAAEKKSMVKVPPWLCLSSPPCDSSARAWRLRAARHTQGEAQPLGSQPWPQVLELAASKGRSPIILLPLTIQEQGQLAQGAGGPPTCPPPPPLTPTLNPEPEPEPEPKARIQSRTRRRTRIRTGAEPRIHA